MARGSSRRDGGKRSAGGDSGDGDSGDRDSGDGDGRAPSSVEATWWSSEDGGPPLTELIAEMQGPLSPWGEDHTLPLPPERVGYTPPTGRPNRAGAN